MKQVSVGMISELQIILELSQNGTKKLCSTLRKGLGQQAVESNITEKLSEIEKTLESFYNVEKMALKDSENNCIFRDVLYVKSTSEFVLEIIKQRDLDPTIAFVRVSLDGGGGFLKVIVNVFETEEFEESETNFKNSRVQRSQIGNVILKLWPEFDNWLADNYIMKRGYQGSGWNGKWK